MDLKQIKELMMLMEKAGITKLRIKDKYEIELEREGEGQKNQALQPLAYHPHFDLAAKAAAGVHKPFVAEEATKVEEKPVEGKFITAPLVGTIYHAQSPDTPVFVKVGDKVSENSVVCIIEAMKVMNEVKAGVSGTVAEILMSNGSPVEFGTKLIRVV